MSTIIQELKLKQTDAANAFNKLNDDPNYQQLRVNAQKAWNEYKNDMSDPEKQAAFEAANAAYAPLYKEATALRATATSLTDQVTQAIEDEDNGSPTPGIEERTAKAEAAGAIAGSQPPPVPAPTNLPVEAESPFNPTDNTTVTADEVQNRLIAAFETTPIRPENTATSYTPPAQNQPQTPDKEPVFIFNQNQLNYLESYNQNLIDSGNEDLIISDLTSGEALTLLSEQGLIQSDDESPIEQQTISRADRSIENPPYSVNIRGVLGDPAIDSEFTETFPPEEQIVVDDSDRYVETVDLTADPLGDLINQIQSGNGQQFSLPTRNQQMAVASPKDWRFRISLSPSANYLYKDANPGILRPLQATNGVIYPYTPSITVNYVANYSTSELTHSNYKIYNYKNSSVESINIVGDFTVQDSAEANYVLAVIHFFKSVTKMFYGQDQNPIRGTPPPLVYLTGFGQYQFDMHPVVITNFTHTFPTDVDYVNAYPTNNSSAIGGQNMQPYMPQIAQFISPLDRLRTLGSKIQVGGTAPPPTFINSQNINEVTRVPSKLNIQLTCLPIVTRNAVSNTFSLRKYASGELMRGSVNFGRTGGGMW